jgi:hypothetical protein
MTRYIFDDICSRPTVALLSTGESQNPIYTKTHVEASNRYASPIVESTRILSAKLKNAQLIYMSAFSLSQLGFFFATCRTHTI